MIRFRTMENPEDDVVADDGEDEGAGDGENDMMAHERIRHP